jgi:hypothetical protein
MNQLNYIAIQANSDLINEITGHLFADGNDYSHNLIIFPNRRPAHFLRKELAGKIGKAFIPPVIFSIDEFIDHVYESKKIDIKLDAIDAVAILYDMHMKSTDKIGHQGFLAPDSFFPLGLKIFSDIEELHIENISVSDVKNIDNFIEGVPQKTLGRLQRLSYFYENFYSLILNNGYSTRSSRYRTIASKVDEHDFIAFSKIILAGFFALTKCEKDIFKKVLLRENSFLIFKDGTGISEQLKRLGIDLKESNQEIPHADIHLYSSPDVHGQVFGLSRLLKDKLDKGVRPNEKTLIAIPSSDTLFPLINHCLSLFNPDNYNISMGYPLYRTPIFGFLNNLTELVMSMNGEKIYLPDYLKFVLHPYTKNILFNNQSEYTRIIFHTIQEELSRHKTIIFLSLNEIEDNDRLLNAILKRLSEHEPDISKKTVSNFLKEIHQNTVSRFISFKNIGDFALKCREILTYIYNNSTARFHPLFYPFSEAFIATLDRISSSLMKNVTFPDTNGYFVFFRRYVMTCTAPFEGAPLKGLQVLGFLETRNLSFDAVYILDVNEDTLPATNKEASLIPFAVRERLKLPTYLDSDKISEYYFDTLIKGSKEAHIFFVEDDEKEKSRFIQKLIWQWQNKERTSESKRYIRPIQYKVDLKSPAPKEIPKTDEIMNVLKGFIFSASALDSYLKCGLQFYYSYILKIEKTDDVTGDIEKTDIGKIIHTALCQYFSKIAGRPLNEKTLSLKKMESVLEGLFDKHFGTEPMGPAYLIQKQIKSHLKDLLMSYYIPLAKETSLEVLNCEYKIENIQAGSYMLKGRLDSIEKRDDKTVIIDYKTSSSSNYYKINFEKLDIQNRASWQEYIGSLQLPFYMLIYSEEKKINIKNLHAMFLLLGRNFIDNKIELPFCDANDIANCYETMKSVILSLLKEINDKGIPFYPTKDIKETCPYCDYKYICGTQWVIKQWSNVR